MFQNPFSFSGRIRRLEYGLSYLIYMVAALMATGLTMTFDDPQGQTANLLIVLFYIPMIWFLLAQGTKRCHDRGNSGWWQIIPFYGFWMIFAEGEIGVNEYGENPKV
ncbi:DUF805 domain-containing protein [Pedobacter immunditicola]|uniref:DUF805 domain-containing protein n=1 Tax=Pedobacter immunditicola TaxID=3133440 RepID=UPI00309D3832